MKDFAKDYDEFPWLRIYDNPPPEPSISRTLLEEMRRRDQGKHDDWPPHPPGSFARRLEELGPKPGALPSRVDPFLVVLREMGEPLHEKTRISISL